MTTNRSSLDEVIRKAVDLNVRYYSGLSQLVANYLKDIVTTFGEVTVSRPTQTEWAQAAPPPSDAQHQHAAAPQQSQKQHTPVMVLEAEAGKEALGVFLVENHLGHDISTRVSPTAFFDAAHNEVKPVFTFDPEAVTLRAGEQVLVRVKAAIDSSFEPDVRYQGFLNIPELVGSKVPIVLRRRPVPREETSF
jgi:hypothetical protein